MNRRWSAPRRRSPARALPTVLPLALWLSASGIADAAIRRDLVRRSSGGRCFLLSLTTALVLGAQPAASAPGDLDATFGSDGRVQTVFDRPASPSAVAADREGRVIAAGGAVTEEARVFRAFALARYNADGSLDQSFGSNGQVTTSFGPGEARIAALVFQPDGKLVAAGYENARNDDNFAVARYNPDGSLDPSFGEGGKVITSFPEGRANSAALVLQRDGKLVVAGRVTVSGQARSQFVLARYNADGSLDQGFGSTGRVTTAFRYTAQIRSLALQPDGRIVAGGEQILPPPGERRRPALARYNADGTLDQRFGSGGKAITVPSEASGISKLLLLPDERLIAGTSDSSLLRFQRNGSVDRTFGRNGRSFPLFNSGVLRDLIPERGGRFIGAVEARQFLLVRYRSDGTVDRSFGRLGSVLTPFAGLTASVRALALQRDGRLVAIGEGDAPSASGSYRFLLARYRTAPIGSVGRLAARQRLREVLSRGIAVPLRCSERCRISAALRLDERVARTLGLPAVVGRAETQLSRAGARRPVISVSRAYRRRLARLSAVELTLRVRFSGAPARPDFESRRIVLR